MQSPLELVSKQASLLARGADLREFPDLFVREAQLVKEAAIEPSGVNDPQNGGEIYVSTTARITFRKQFANWAKRRNNVLNWAIATAFAKGEPHQYFKPKQGSGADVGEVRLYGQTKFIGIVFGSDVRIIAVKGTLPNIGEPPAQAPSGQSGGQPGGDPSGWQVADVGQALQGT